MRDQFSIKLLALAVIAASPVFASANDSSVRLKDTTIIGSKADAKKIAGSAFVLDKADLDTFSYSDINRMLGQVPGVYLREEEGFGLRPNIGIRGTGTDRSGKITVMEDGVLVAPNPYANPAAYYFPTAGRMSGIEVLKGPSTLRYGPSTVGGAINLLSTPIPNQLGGSVVTEVGERGENRLFANVGAGAQDNFGWLIETHQIRNDGFKSIDRSNTDAGIKKEDYMAKLRFQNDADSSMPQRLDLKLSYAIEDSNMSYVGLTDADFSHDPNRRYGLSEKDEMKNRHTGAVADYFLGINENVDFHAKAYYNKFHRDWFKVDRIGGKKIGDVIGAANAGDLTAIGILNGSVDQDVTIKHNNRDYISQGVEFDFDVNFDLASWQHDLNVGTRFHQEEMDRLQPTEKWRQTNGSMAYISGQAKSSLTGSNNRFEDTDAISLWAIDQISVTEALELTLALRYEDWKVKRADVQSNGTKKKRSVSGSEWLPGIGATYQIDDQWQVLGGVHKGIAIASFNDGSDNPDPEETINYEAGVRFAQGDFQSELIGFYSDYKSSVLNCSLQRPCDSGAVTGSEPLGEAEVKGVEASASYTFSASGLSWPVRAAYTYTDAKFTKNPAGKTGMKGGKMAYIPENQLYVSAGVVGNKWDAYLNARFTDQSCTVDACDKKPSNTFLKTDSIWVLDLATHYQLNDQVQAYFKLDNLLDDQKIISRSPDGARGNKPRTALVGLKVDF
ncbi:MAG: TonB-dependent receptor [Pseudomonas sp.]|nr:TonB-dependent receptor [Pseudomonas sp.]